MWQHALILFISIVLVVASAFTLGFVNFALGGIVMAAAILSAAVALWGLVEKIGNSPLTMDTGRATTLKRF